MKRLGGIWNRVASFDNLLLAYRKAWYGNQSRVEQAQRFHQPPA
jgi:hypothetical protein